MQLCCRYIRYMENYLKEECSFKDYFFPPASNDKEPSRTEPATQVEMIRASVTGVFT